MIHNCINMWLPSLGVLCYINCYVVAYRYILIVFCNILTTSIKEEELVNLLPVVGCGLNLYTF